MSIRKYWNRLDPYILFIPITFLLFTIFIASYHSYVYKPNLYKSLSLRFLNTGVSYADALPRYMSTLKPNSFILRQMENLSGLKITYIGVYDERMVEITKKGKLNKSTNLNSHMSGNCGFLSVLKNVKPCIQYIKGVEILGGYYPLLQPNTATQKNEIIGVLYLEVDNTLEITALDSGIESYKIFMLCLYLSFSTLFTILLKKTYKRYFSMYFSLRKHNSHAEFVCFNRKILNPVLTRLQHKESVLKSIEQNTKIKLLKNQKINSELNKHVLELKSNSDLAVKSKSLLLANTSHDIRTPLNAILGYSQEMLSETQSQTNRRYLNSIHSSAEMLMQTVDAVLNYDSLEKNSDNLTIEKLIIDKQVEVIIEGLSQAKRSENVILYSVIDLTVPNVITSNKQGIVAIITNLATNAINHTMNGSVVVRVGYIRHTEIAGTLILRVQDTGKGLSLIQQKTVFDQYETYHTSTSKNFKSRGLGLSIVKTYAENLGGIVSLKSEEGVGSTFEVSLPVETGEILEIEPPNKTSMKVIVICEDEGISASIFNKFSRLCFEVLLHSSFDEVVNHDLSKGCLIAIHLKKPDDYNRYATSLSFIDNAQCHMFFTRVSKSNIEFIPKCKKNSILPIEASSQSIMLEYKAITGVSNLQIDNYRLKNKKILIVDDVLENSRLLQIQLKKSESKLFVAEDGLQALNMCKEQFFDIILMDAQMPVMDGYESIRLIRKDSMCKSSVIIAVTASVTKEDTDNFMESGAEQVLSKPLSRKILLSTLNNVMNIQATSITEENCDLKYDISQLVEEYEMSEEDINQIVNENIITLNKWINIIPALLAKNDVLTLKVEMHKLLGHVKTCGYPNLINIVQKLDLNLRDIEHKSTIGEELSEQIQDMVASLKNVKNHKENLKV